MAGGFGGGGVGAWEGGGWCRRSAGVLDWCERVAEVVEFLACPSQFVVGVFEGA